MVGGEDHQRIVRQAGLLQSIQQPADMGIGGTHLAVIDGHQLPPLGVVEGRTGESELGQRLIIGGETAVELIAHMPGHHVERLVRVDVVHPGIERPLTVGGDEAQRFPCDGGVPLRLLMAGPLAADLALRRAGFLPP